MKALLALCLALATIGDASAVRLSPAPYYSLNPHDDLVLGPGLVLEPGDVAVTDDGDAAGAPAGGARGGIRRLELGVGYSFGQSRGRGRARYTDAAGLGPRTGFDLQGFHEVQACSALVPLNQAGFYEGRTGAMLSVFHRLSPNELGTVSLISDKIWRLRARSNLQPTDRDRIYSVRVAFERDTRDDRLNPRSGLRATAVASQAVRVFGGTRAYLSSAATWTRYQRVGETGALGWRAHVAATRGTLPNQRRIRLPGEGVRGYDFVTNGGTLAAVANGELRMPMVPREGMSLGSGGTLVALQLAAFADAGAVRRSTGTWNLRGSVGLGVRAPLVAFRRVPMVCRLDVAQGMSKGGRLKTYLLVAAPELELF